MTNDTTTMDPTDPLSQAQTAFLGAIGDIQSAFEGADFTVPGMGSEMDDAPFADTQAAFEESAGDIENFFTDSLVGYGQQTADIVANVADQYQTAFEGAANAFPVPGMEEDDGMGDDDENMDEPAAPGTATADALEEGLDGLGEAVAESLGTTGEPDQMFGAVYAAETVGDALVGFGKDVGDTIALGADIIAAGAAAFAEQAGGGDNEMPGMMPPIPGEEMLVTGIQGGFTALTEGYNMGASALSGVLPRAIADGLDEVGTQILTNAQMGADEIIGAFGGDTGMDDGDGMDDDEEMDDGEPSFQDDPAAAFQGIIDDIAANLTPDEETETPDPVAELTGLFEQGAEEFMNLIGGGNTDTPDPVAELTALGGEIESGISSAATEFQAVLGQLESLGQMA